MGSLTARLGASAMAAAVAVDPQFTMPVRPRLVTGLVIEPLPNGLLFEGTGTRQVLHGGAASTLVPRLLALLDGTRTIDRLCADAPDVSTKDIHSCLALLYVSGVLEDASVGRISALLPVGVDPDTAGYLGRHLDSTRVNRSRAQALARLASARVRVAGSGPLVQRLRAELARTGVAFATDAADLVVALDDGDFAVLEMLDADCARTGTRWLRTAVHGDTVELGPIFDRAYTCCYRCFAAGRAGPGPAPIPARAAIWAALAATEVVHLVARIGRPVTGAGCAVLDLANWTQRIDDAYRRPGCPDCCPLAAPPQEPPLAFRYEQAVAFPPREWLNPKDHQHHYRPANLALQRDCRSYPTAPSVALPAPVDGLVPDEDGRLTLAVLAGLLVRTVGLRDDGPAAVPGKVQRYAPTGGNLGSVQAYLLARDVAGLPDGWYFYQAGEHTLARLADPFPVPDPPAALLVLTGALGRVMAKYHDFGYRTVCLDAGVAVAQLSAVAAGYRLGVRLLPDFDEAVLNETLHPDEPITAVLALDHGGTR